MPRNTPSNTPFDRVALEAARGLHRFDELDPYGIGHPKRLRVLWLENSLDCRMWAYYCDIRAAMAKLHDLCTPRGKELCLGTKSQPFIPDFAVIGPRYSINIVSADDPVGFDRHKLPNMPLLVMQNKMYIPKGWREIVGNLTAKLNWVRAAGAAGAFTWLTQHHHFTHRSGVPHHWLPFGVDVEKYSHWRGQFGATAQPFDVGFTGASGADKYPLRSALLQELKQMNVTGFFGTWSQTALNKKDPNAWKAGDHDEYAAQIARARIWLSTTGPSQLVGTRYFEILASGTTLLMCNRPPRGAWVYDGLFEDGKHVVMFDNVADMRAKVLRYLKDESERRRIVLAAHNLTRHIHSWDARAIYITRVAEQALRYNQLAANAMTQYTPPPWAKHADDPSYLGCFLLKRDDLVGSGVSEPSKSRNKRRLFRYTVAQCEAACLKDGKPFAALNGGGFTTGNGHTLARCMCAIAELTVANGWQKRHDSECATTCALHDSRPCGGHRAYSLFKAIVAPPPPATRR